VITINLKEIAMRDNFEANLHIKVTATMYKALSDHAKESGRSVSEIVRGLISEEVRASKSKDASIARELIGRIDSYGKKLKALGVEKE
jgi:negative regulator of replication initiation